MSNREEGGGNVYVTPCSFFTLFLMLFFEESFYTREEHNSDRLYIGQIYGFAYKTYILDGNSEHVAHVWRKIGVIWNNSDCSQI